MRPEAKENIFILYFPLAGNVQPGEAGVQDMQWLLWKKDVINNKSPSLLPPFLSWLLLLSKHHMVWNIPLASLGQLPQLCPL